MKHEPTAWIKGNEPLVGWAAPKLKPKPPVSLPNKFVAGADSLEETRLPRVQLLRDELTRSFAVALYAALVSARVGVVEWRGISYALTWDAGEEHTNA